LIIYSPQRHNGVVAQLIYTCEPRASSAISFYENRILIVLPRKGLQNNT